MKTETDSYLIVGTSTGGSSPRSPLTKKKNRDDVIRLKIHFVFFSPKTNGRGSVQIHRNVISSNCGIFFSIVEVKRAWAWTRRLGPVIGPTENMPLSRFEPLDPRV